MRIKQEQYVLPGWVVQYPDPTRVEAEMKCLANSDLLFLQAQVQSARLLVVTSKATLCMVHRNVRKDLFIEGNAMCCTFRGSVTERPEW